MLAKITKFCHQCQIHSKAPDRFRFNIKDDMNFNAELIINIMYINKKPVLYVVNSVTVFQAAKFLHNIIATIVWEALQLCWLNIYTNPSDIIVHNAGTNFTAKKFHQSASALSITVKKVSVKSHNSISTVERYYASLRRAY